MIRRWIPWQRDGDAWQRRRQQMIDEHSDFLTWAMRHDARLPRIPRRRVDQGGFEHMYRRHDARRLANQWWWRALSLVESVTERR